MNYEESYEILDLLDKYTDMTQKVKSFDDTEARILEIINGYQKGSKKDLDLSVLDSLDPQQLNACIKIICEAYSEIAPQKKEAKLTIEILKKSIGEKVLDMCQKENNTTLTMKFDGYGSVKVTENEVFALTASEDEIEEIIDSIYSMGLTQFLKIDEKPYLAFAEKFKKDNCKYLPGVTSRIEVTPKILGRKTK